MLALAYDGGLRREELCSLRTDDLDPGQRMVRIRAETTKTRRERIPPYSVSEGKTSREIRRCLKRYITRELYRTLTATMTPISAAPSA